MYENIPWYVLSLNFENMQRDKIIEQQCITVASDKKLISPFPFTEIPLIFMTTSHFVCIRHYYTVHSLKPVHNFQTSCTL